MGLAPLKDRTITLTLERDLAETSPDVVKLSTTKGFSDRFLPTRGLGGFIRKKIQGDKTREVVLRGATNISISHSAGVAQSSGLATSFIQPWFIGNIPITIKGQSYLGAYSALSVPDRDVERVLRAFRRSLNDFSSNLGAPGSKERVLLEIKGNPKGARRFLGFITDLDWNEDTNNPYLLDYSISFLGRNVDNAALVKGKANAQREKRKAQGTNG